MSKTSTIDGQGSESCSPPRNLSTRAINGKLFVEKNQKTICPYCDHNKKFIGNSMGLMINKCSKCKRAY